MTPHLVLNVLVSAALEQIAIEDSAVVKGSRIVKWGSTLLKIESL
jgi:hypothetical protein